jgi:hypothetical protein
MVYYMAGWGDTLHRRVAPECKFGPFGIRDIFRPRFIRQIAIEIESTAGMHIFYGKHISPWVYAKDGAVARQVVPECGQWLSGRYFYAVVERKTKKHSTSGTFPSPVLNPERQIIVHAPEHGLLFRAFYPENKPCYPEIKHL